MKARKTLLASILIVAMILSLPGMSLFARAEEETEQESAEIVAVIPESSEEETPDPEEDVFVEDAAPLPASDSAEETDYESEPDDTADVIDVAEDQEPLDSAVPESDEDEVSGSEIAEEAMDPESQGWETPEAVEEEDAAADPADQTESGSEETSITESSEKDDVSFLPGLAPSQSDMNGATVIQPWYSYFVSLSAGEHWYYRFTPSASGTYRFSSSTDELDPRAYLYDSSGTKIAENDDISSGENPNRNFLIVASLKAGQTYYYEVSFYSAYASGDFYVYLARDGWRKDGDDWYYYENGQKKYGWLKDSGKWYYLNPRMLVNNILQDTDGKYYGFGADGAMVTNDWVKIVHSTSEGPATVWYYAGSNGVLVTGWKKIDGKSYYFDSSFCYMYADGVREINGKKYLFLKSGALAPKGWHKITWDGGYSYYYVYDDGVIATGWKKIDGKWYYFSDWGYMQTQGISEINGKKYLFLKSGELAGAGWHKITWDSGFTWYYTDADGIITRSWKKINGKWYYFDPDWGYMYTQGVQEIKGKKYLLLKSGELAGAGWHKITWDSGGFNWYYTDADGIIATGWKKIDGKWYYFNPDWGYMYVNAIYEISGKMYLFLESGELAVNGWHKKTWSGDYSYYYYSDSDGVLASGWLTIKGKRYYFDSSSHWMYSGGVRTVDGSKYFFLLSGELAGAGWHSLTSSVGGVKNTEWYYTNSDGTIVTGWKVISGKKYYFQLSGFMSADGLFYVDGEWEYFDENGVWQPKSGSGWVQVSGRTRYIKSDGSYAKGWLKIGTKYYYFDSNGDMQTGWVQSGGKWYFCTPAMLANTVYYYASNYYFFDSNGARKDTIGWASLKYQYPDGRTETRWYYVKTSGGILVNEDWVKDNGKWYYFRPYMAASQWVTIGEYSYFFDENGVWDGSEIHV